MSKPGRQGLLDQRTYQRSIASMSWIDPASKLPEVDKLGEPAQEILRDLILGKQAYRFANFLQVEVKVLPTVGDLWIGGYRFLADSRMYRGLSFAGIPSEPFQTRQFVEASDANSITFRQITGARTQSAEVIAGKVGGPFGAIGQDIAELLFPFPPIWTDLQLTVYRDGYYEGQVLRHSLFPSMSFYEGHVLSLDVKGDLIVEVQRAGIRQRGSGEKLQHVAGALGLVKVIDDGFYHRRSTYDGVPNYADWMERGWGDLDSKGQGTGPMGGNPWGIENRKGLGGRPGMPGETIEQTKDKSGRPVPELDTK
jgi:hypothetical protein